VVQPNHLTGNLAALLLDRAASPESVLASLLYSVRCCATFLAAQKVTLRPGCQRLEHPIYIFVRAKLQVKYLFIKHGCLKG